MITFKPIIIQGGRRKDGTWPVKIRVTFKGSSRRLPTTLTCTDADLTRSGRIKNATLLDKAGALISRMRAATDTLSPFVLEGWDVDAVVLHIKDALQGETFRLDFFAFGRSLLPGKKSSTAAGYVTAMNAFARYLGRGEIDVNEITQGLLRDFVEHVDNEPKITYKGTPTARSKAKGNASALYLHKLAAIFAAARLKYNDEDAGRILIPRSPFERLRLTRSTGTGQRNLGPEVMQRLISYQPGNEKERLAFDAFLVSFALMGVNLADMYAARTEDVGERWRFFRQKTGCEVLVYIPDCIMPQIGRLRGQYGDAWWLGALHRWRDVRAVGKMINRWLQEWAEREGVETFTFYAARHTWASLARRQGVELAVVDEALGHKGAYRMADIYAERNWDLAREANVRVLGMFSWPK